MCVFPWLYKQLHGEISDIEWTWVEGVHFVLPLVKPEEASVLVKKKKYNSKCKKTRLWLCKKRWSSHKWLSSALKGSLIEAQQMEFRWSNEKKKYSKSLSSNLLFNLAMCYCLKINKGRAGYSMEPGNCCWQHTMQWPAMADISVFTQWCNINAWMLLWSRNQTTVTSIMQYFWLHEL